VERGTLSRIQNILAKAERDGSVRRVRTMTDTAGASALAFDTTPAPVSDPVPFGVPSASSIRTVSATEFDPSLMALLSPGAPVAEQYRALRTRIAQSDRGSAVDVVLVTSPGRGEGKSLTAANLALSTGQDFQTRICLIDADLRTPRLHKLFGVADTPGLSDVLSGSATLAEALIAFENPRMVLLPAGHPPSHPADLLGSTAMRRTIETLRTQFDRVIIDAAAVTPLADVGILAPQVDGVLLVVRAGVTTKPAIQEAVAAIPGDRFLGAVLNDSVA
jgi:capsular exopolysaccharide synthesis family protein